MRLLLATVVLALLALPAAATELVFEFSGSVFLVDDPDGDGPAVSVGDRVDGFLTYVIEDAVPVTVTPTFGQYDFSSGTMTAFVNFTDLGVSLQLSSSEGSAASLLNVDPVAEVWTNTVQADPFSGSPVFPFAYASGTAAIDLRLEDRVLPLTLLDTTALVDEGSDVDLGAADLLESFGIVRATEPLILPSAQDWQIRWRFDRLVVRTESGPVSVEETSFGAVKARY